MLPDLPTVGDFLPGLEESAFFGIGAPKNTPAEIVESSTRISIPALPIPADPGIKTRLADLGDTAFQARPPSSGSSSPRKPRNGDQARGHQAD
jgi:hypothetical protein